MSTMGEDAFAKHTQICSLEEKIISDLYHDAYMTFFLCYLI